MKKLEFCKKILQKVSFDKTLFRKELVKAINWVRKEDKILLKVWCLASFGHLYKDIIIEVFSKISK